MKMIRILGSILTASCLFVLANPATAGMIYWDPTDGEGDVGDPISMDLVWEGEEGEYLGDWDIQIVWDSAIASASAIFLDPELGMDSLGCLDCGIGPVDPGDVSAYVVSFDSPADLMTNQDSLGRSFVLMSFTFVGVSPGVTNLNYGLTTFGDENGLRIDPTLRPGRICVGPDGCPPPPQVSEPSVLALLGLGLFAAGFARRRTAAA
jgi:hypothetical protein